MPSTSRGYVYPASTDHNRLWEHFLALADSLNVDIEALDKKPCGKLVAGSGSVITLAHNTVVAISFPSGSEVFDSHDYHVNATPTRVTPTKAGIYDFNGAVAIAGRTDYQGIEVGLAVNGVSQAPATRITPSASNVTLVIPVSGRLSLNGSGDYVELYVRHQNTANVSVGTIVSSQFASGLDWEYVRPPIV